MADAEATQVDPNEKQAHPNSGSWLEVAMTALATIGLLTIVIGGAVLISAGLADDDDEPRIIRVVERPQDEPEQICYEEVVPRGGGGLFGNIDDDDFDAESQFADSRDIRVVIVCEDW